MNEGIELKPEKSDQKEEKGSILIVDDDQSIRQICKAYLESKGFEAHAASLAEEAIKILNETNFDLVITNLRMPGMNGMELTKLIKDRYDSDVIIVTGYHSYTFEEAILVGASDLLHKPAKLEDLLVSINRMLDK
jgi:DNA-binding NtrC family response regulator